MTDTTAIPEQRDVNDVLSSIRKLVSAEADARTKDAEIGFPARNGKALADAEGDAKPLVLTTDLRVVARRKSAADEVAGDPLRLVPADESEAALTESVVQEPPKVATGDEELREIVRDVLREELEGEIGERISRNVLQMIRREIARTLRIDAEDL